MPLCAHCSRLAPEWLIPEIYDKRPGQPGKPPKGDIGPHYRWTYSSWAELRESAKSCELCSLIVREARPMKEGRFYRPLTDKWKGVRIQAFGVSRFDVVYAEEELIAHLRFGFDTDDAERAPQDAQQFTAARITDSYSGGSQNINAMKRWISTCRSSHSRCSTWTPGKKGRHLPTRILDVANGTLRLHEPLDSEEDEYLALTYCWGDGNPYKTIKSNLDQHRAGFPLSALPPALQDAVHLTRALGFRYIWIDALCIVQDDRKDWLREASMMKAVYTQAFLTISLDTLADTTTRFLGVKRSDRHDLRVTLPWVRDTVHTRSEDGGQDNHPGALDGSMQNLSVADEPTNIYVLPRFRSFGEEISASPLAKRGWTFQERALSARIIHLGRDSSYWECKECCHGEDYATVQGAFDQDKFSNIRDMLLDTGKDYHGNDMTAAKLQDKWAWVAEEYSRRALTRPGDLFPALEGIATLFAEKMGGVLGTFLCGLWENEFLRGLLWVSDYRVSSMRSPGGRHRRCAEYRAPSWSWASVCGPIRNQALEFAYVRTPDGGLEILKELGNSDLPDGSGRLTNPLLAVREIQVSTEGDSSFGAVTRASFTASAMLTPVRRVRLPPTGGAGLGRGVCAVVATTTKTTTTTGQCGFGVAFWDEDEDEDEGENEGKVGGGAAAAGGSQDPEYWICPVYMVRDMKEGWPLSECLVLRKSVRVEGAFERVAKAKVTTGWLEGTVERVITVV